MGIERTVQVDLGFFLFPLVEDYQPASQSTEGRAPIIHLIDRMQDSLAVCRLFTVNLSSISPQGLKKAWNISKEKKKTAGPVCIALFFSSLLRIEYSRWEAVGRKESISDVLSMMFSLIQLCVYLSLCLAAVVDSNRHYPNHRPAFFNAS